MNPQASDLNNTIENQSPAIFELLSRKGKEIFFPKKGILAQTADAKGKDIDATIGIALEEDGSPMRLNAVADLVSLPPENVFPYAPSFGRPDLRKVWKDLIIKKNPKLTQDSFSNPVVSNALTHGLSLIGYMLCDEGDKIIIPDLYWGNYNLIFKNGFGADFDTFETYRGDAFNVQGLKEKLQGESKKIILLNFPNNPTGYTPTEDEVERIVSVIKEAAEQGQKIAVIIDDAYFGLVYKEGIYKYSIFQELAQLHENILAIKLDGATKEDYVWGLRVGFMSFASKGATKEVYEAMEAKVAGAVRGNISNDSNLSQSIMLKAFTDSNYIDNKKEKYDILKARFDAVQKSLEDHPEYLEKFTPVPHNSGYFMCIKLNQEAESVRQTLLEKYSTGVIALGDILRLAYSATPTDKIPVLFDNIFNACKENE